MPNCVKCGEEISKEQLYNFKGMCPHCVRIQPLRRGVSVGKWCVMCIVSLMALLLVLML
ncbi:hypothetical protein ES708_26932 [subsurface metagenome]